jgi:hypothetical protein
MRCIFAMVVTATVTFDEYWAGVAFSARRPKRNGSSLRLVGDNIYHRDTPHSPWRQEDSVHSLANGEQCALNTAHDTRVNRVLLSERFIYFGSAAEPVPADSRKAMGYSRNARDFRRFGDAAAAPLLDWLVPQMCARPNTIVADPIGFASAPKRFSAALQRLV